MIGGVARVVIDVKDQDRAKEFWTAKMDFKLMQDAPYGDERWLEVRCPDEGVILVLHLLSDAERSREPADSVPDMLPTSNVMFYCDDIQQTHKELSQRGVDFTQPPVQQAFGWWSLFTDKEGNRFALSQRDS